MILRTGEGFAAFYCPGCNQAHAVRLAPTRDPWTWNGNVEKPTFHPSVLTSHWAWPEGNEKLPPGEDGRIQGAHEVICHSYVTDGKIQFLGDCGHELRGQTVDLPDFPEDYGDGGDEE